MSVLLLLKIKNEVFNRASNFRKNFISFSIILTLFDLNPTMVFSDLLFPLFLSINLSILTGGDIGHSSVFVFIVVVSVVVVGVVSVEG